MHYPSATVIGSGELAQEPLFAVVQRAQVMLREGLVANGIAGHGTGLDSGDSLLDASQLLYVRFWHSAAKIARRTVNRREARCYRLATASENLVSKPGELALPLCSAGSGLTFWI